MINKKRNAFTLAELVMVMIIIAVLSTGLVFGVSTYVNKARDICVDTALKSINTTIDYLSEQNGKLPNIAKIKSLMGETSYKFNLSDVLISDISGTQMISIRAETTQLSKYNIPYAITVVAKYKGEFGVKNDGDIIDTTLYEDELLNYNVDSITMIVLDNTPSGVPEIYWLN